MRRGALNLDEAASKLISGEAANAFQSLLRARQMESDSSIANQGECHPRISDRVGAELLLDMGIFRGLRPQEFTARRHIEKQRSHLNDRAGSSAMVLHSHEFAAHDFDFRAAQRLSLARGQAKAGNAGDAGQCLAAKTKGFDGRQILLGAYLAGGMAFNAQQGVLTIHSDTVIRDANQRRPSALDLDSHMRGSSIQTVFHQFTNHSSRPFHDFSSCHLAGECVGENADFRHRMCKD